MELMEGSETGFINFHTSLPPSIMCNDTDSDLCQLRIEVSIQTTSRDFSCVRNGVFANRIPQALVGFYADYDPGVRISCGLVVNETNWHRTLMIPVAATIDRLIDGDQTREIRVYQTLVVGSIVISRHLVKTVSVRKE